MMNSVSNYGMFSNSQINFQGKPVNIARIASKNPRKLPEVVQRNRKLAEKQYSNLARDGKLVEKGMDKIIKLLRRIEKYGLESVKQQNPKLTKLYKEAFDLCV